MTATPSIPIPTVDREVSDVYKSAGLLAARAKREASVWGAAQRAVQLFEEHHPVGPRTRALWRRSNVL